MASSLKTLQGQQKIGVAPPYPQRTFRKWISRLIFALLLAMACVWLDAIKSRWYVLDPKILHELAQSAIAQASTPDDLDGMIRHIVTNLTNTYPSTTIALNTNSDEWVFNNAGGAMGAMYIIHASVTEYLFIFGTPLGTEGHTGRHTVDDYFHILVGEQWAFSPGQLKMERYPPGSVHHLPRGAAKQYKMHEGCFALEYARGWIPFMVPFGFADVFTSTLDVPTLYQTVRVTIREMGRNLFIGKI